MTSLEEFINDCGKEIARDVIWKLENGEEISIDNITGEEYFATEEIRCEIGRITEEILEKEYGITDDDLFSGITKKELDERKGD